MEGDGRCEWTSANVILESLNAPATEVRPEQPLTLRAAPKAAAGPGLVVAKLLNGNVPTSLRGKLGGLIKLIFTKYV